METPSSSDRHFANLSDADKLLTAEGALVALETEPEIIEAMTKAKYTPDGKLVQGRALLLAARQAMEAQSERVGERLEQTVEQKDALADAQAQYSLLAGLARAVFRKRREVLTALGLTGEHGDSYGERIARMRLFTREARHADRLPELVADGLDVRELDELDEAVDTAEREIVAQDRLEARAEHSTEGREGAFAALVDWVLTMHGHARVRLRKKAQLLEMLGIPRRR